MKIKHLFGLAVLAAMTASCSSNDDLANNPGTGASETGVGYATFSINLPTTSAGSRADAGGADMNAGTEDEYKVTDATALIFKKSGASENDYLFVESVDLGTLNWNKDGVSAGVTTQASVVAKLKGVANDGTYYALVLLNNKTTDGNAKITLPTSGTYGSWNNTALSVSNLADNAIFMANAPLLTSAAPSTLVNIATDQIYPSKEKAEAAQSKTEIYVERAVAKVDVNTPTANLEVKKNNVANGDKVNFKNWALDVTNKKTFAVHNITGLTTDFPTIWSTDRFKGTNYRIYWGIDPNYSNDKLKTETDFDSEKTNEFNYITANDVTGSFNTTDKVNSQYCLENTFNLANMFQGQTTRVVFKSVYTPKGMDEGKTFFKVGKMETLMNAETLKATINKAANEVLTGCKLDDNASLLTNGGVHFLTYADLKDNAGNSLEENTASYNSKTGKEVAEAINAKLGLEDADRPEDKVGINTYKDGVTYYIARIKHFGDAQKMTPWNPGDETYGANNEKYLGRYGVLRNNWYNLSINSVSGPGYPDVPPTDPDMPDDENEKYISVSVKILDWAKRSQNVDL